MKKHWLQQNNTSNLILYFSGWGLDVNAILHLEQAKDDICVVFDYSDLNNFNLDAFKTYSNIRLIAWSMGVWVAAHILQNTSLSIIQAIAINGTELPIDDQFGIPNAVFAGTLDGLSLDSISKFDRRMCGSKSVYQQFTQLNRTLEIDDLKSELQNIFLEVKKHPKPSFNWTKAFVGQSDLIFPTSNQINYWGEKAVYVDSMPHFPFFVYQSLEELF